MVNVALPQTHACAWVIQPRIFVSTLIHFTHITPFPPYSYGFHLKLNIISTSVQQVSFITKPVANPVDATTVYHWLHLRY